MNYRMSGTGAVGESGGGCDAFWSIGVYGLDRCLSGSWIITRLVVAVFCWNKRALGLGFGRQRDSCSSLLRNM